MTDRTRWLRAIAVVTLLVAALAVGTRFLRSGASAPRSDADRAFAELAELRDSVAACTAELELEHDRFRAQEARVDSLRGVVEGWESDERTVPAGEFDAYLEAFDAYNASVEAWHERADALQAADEACRALAERHNALVDSLSAPAGGGPAADPV